MSDCKPNRSIRCTVKSCANHCSGENFCSLDTVSIGTHEGDPAMNQCTDCLSFRNVNATEQAKSAAQYRCDNGGCY